MNYKWPLAINNFTFLDRLKICAFFLKKNNRWTQDKCVKTYEKAAKKYVRCAYAVFVSSGSTANQLIAQEIKDRLIKLGEWPKRNKVIVSAVTWQTNVSPWVREGYEPIFVDVNLEDFCFDYDQVEKILSERKQEIACVFPTSVLGFTPDIDRLKQIHTKYRIEVCLDNCENFFGSFGAENVSSHFTSSTSCFVAHHITTGQEGGFIFTNSPEKYEYFLLSRAHGLFRNIGQYGLKSLNAPNELVHSQFDFQTLSSNYRSSDIAAFCGLLDFKRANQYKEHRIELYNLFSSLLDRQIYYLPSKEPLKLKREDVAFCLPIVCRDKYIVEKIKSYLSENKIEHRPFISGNMLRQIPYQKYGDYKDFPNAEFLNNNALYVGLHMEVTEKMIRKLAEDLNDIR